MNGLLKCLTDCVPKVKNRRLKDKLTFRRIVYIAALGVWAVIGLAYWLVTLVT
jgi:hypothetical protein